MTQVAHLEPSIFRNKTVFAMDYVPDRILHRDSQTRQIAEILSDMNRNTRPRNILCLGSFGTGKTAVIRRFCRGLTEGVKFAYVNCAEHDTQSRIIRETLRQLGREAKLGFPKDHYLALFKLAASECLWLILVLDEVDRFMTRRDSDSNAWLYTLSRSIPNVVTIMATNRIDIQQLLQAATDSRVLDTFRYSLVEFGDYTAEELGNILRERCMSGLSQGSYDEGLIAAIALKASMFGLHARGLIDVTRKAGELAEARRQTTITLEDVREAVKEVCHEQELTTIARLPAVQKLIIGRVLKAGGSMITQMLYDWYRTELCKTIDVGSSRSRFCQHLKQIETMGIFTIDSPGLGRAKGRESRVTIPAEMIPIVTSSLAGTEDTHPTVEFVTQSLATTPTPHTAPHFADLDSRETEQTPSRENEDVTLATVGSGSPLKDACGQAEGETR
jgi:cell division control protein 6